MRRTTYDRIKHYTVQKFGEYLYHSGHDDRLAALLEISISASKKDHQIRMTVTGKLDLVQVLRRDAIEEELTEELIDI